MLACSRGPAPEETADAIYTGGDIVTIHDAQPTAEVGGSEEQGAGMRPM